MADSYTVKPGDKFSPFTGQAITAPPGTVIYGDTTAKKDFGTSVPSATPTQAFSADQPTYTVKAGDKFNPYNGQPLNNAPVGTTIQNPFGTPTQPKLSPEDQKLVDLGVSPQDIAKLNTPEGLDPGAFQTLIGNVETKLKTNNDLVTQRGYLIKHLYDSPLTKDELKQLPEDIQQVIKSGDQDTIQLQIRLLNDQIAGRANTLSQSIGYLTDGYNTSVTMAEKQKNDAINTVLDFVGAYGSKAPQVLSSLYGPQYLDKLKQMGIDIAGMAAIPTISEQRYATTTNGSFTVDIPGGTIASQTNNPLNIKYVSGGIAGGTDSGIKAKDGGTFAAFQSPEEGLQAAISLLKSSNYQNLTIDQAMKRWSNSGYGAEVSPGMNPNQQMSSLSDDQLQKLVSDMAKRESGTTVSASLNDIQEIAKAIESGSQPPDLSRLYGKSAQVRAQLARDGYDFTKASLDWTATLAFAKNSNNAQQIRMRQAEESVEQSLPNLQTYVDKLNADGAMTGFQFLNKASLEAAKNGAFGSKVASDAQALLGQISLITDELGQTFMGGNSPTDAAFSLAKGVLAGNFTADQFKTQIDLIKQNLQIRKNSWSSAGITTVSGGTNAYAPSSSGSYEDYLKAIQ